MRADEQYGWSGAMRTQGGGSPAGEDFHEVFCALLPRLYRRAALLAGRSGAEDAVHEAYLKLSSRPRRLLDHPEPYAYAFAAMVSVIRDEWRRDRRQALVPLTGDEIGSWDGGIGHREAELEAVELLSGLSAKQAAAVLLVDLDGYTIDEAADILGVHRGTVSRARARALLALRSSLTTGTGREGRDGDG
ncbi:RNA polymerase sigma factor [Actinoallomurus purpureus]|uniref:RNA polymerase sigma factor n=1 Tax=Actinoallomurus purpureus TaxID=478114 RepID=UPI0020930A27|nr:RNA polymerase sigma factor [Actinoallomurus purpureus]MCO6010086.1 RNA polymerase sigma factor [Actinoallomurus purpureus]